jgi:prepilin-type N-terminal cleavage/methylation domain-containing protein
MQLNVTRRIEAGFTMVELLVAMVLGAIVMAFAVGTIMDLFGASDRATQNHKAQKAAALAADMLVSDVRSMRAPQREPQYTGSLDNLRSILLDNSAPALRVHDLLEATPTRILFYSELVQGNVGPECVTWFVIADGSMRREVRQENAGCTGGTATRGGGSNVLYQSTVVMPKPEVARASAAAKVPDPFSFNLLVVANPANPDPSTCTTPSVKATLSALQRDQVTAINMDLRSFVAGRIAKGDQQLDTAAAVASRQAMEYRYGIGCVA